MRTDAHAIPRCITPSNQRCYSAKAVSGSDRGAPLDPARGLMPPALPVCILAYSVPLLLLLSMIEKATLIAPRAGAVAPTQMSAPRRQGSSRWRPPTPGRCPKGRWGGRRNTGYKGQGCGCRVARLLPHPHWCAHMAVSSTESIAVVSAEKCFPPGLLETGKLLACSRYDEAAAI